MAKLIRQMLNLSRNSPSVFRMQNTSANLLDPELESARSYDEVPREKGFPIIGTTWLFLPFIGKYNPQKRHEAIKQQYQKYGKIVREDLTPFLKFLHLFDVKDIEKVFRYEGRYPNRNGLECIKFYREKRSSIYTNNGLLSEQETRWYEIRSKVQKHMLRPASVQYYLPVMDTISKELVDKIEDLKDDKGEIANFLHELYKWALESVGSVAFDTRLGCLKKDITTESEPWRVIQAVNDVFDLMLQLEFSGFKLWRFFPSRTKSKFFKDMDFLSNVAQKYIKEALDRVEMSPSEDSKGTFLENLLSKEKMDFSHATVMLIDMLLAGIDTTSHSTAFTLYYLAKNEDCQQKLYEEISRVLPDYSSSMTVSLLNECRYLKAVVKESMRLKPIILSNIRSLDEDIVLSGYRVPAGIGLIMENYVICQLEENFSDPLSFKPERWLRGTNEEKFNPFVFLPFGFGARSCIGRRIAEQEIWTLLIRIIQKYRVEYHHEDIDLHTRLINAPDKPLRLTFIPR